MEVNGIYTILQATSYPARSVDAQSINIWMYIRWTIIFVYAKHHSGKRGTNDDDTSKETLMMTPMAWPSLVLYLCEQMLQPVSLHHGLALKVV